MGIYRGPGGSGDAVNDSSSETRLAVEARDAALAAQAAAEAAQAAAETAETNAETAETNAETAETNAETAATNAASSASSASTSATNAASSASSASTSATNAASSASSASTSATNAASSASSASSSASSASTSASNAATSATAAQAAQAAAEAAFDAFDDIYLGAKSSNPTVDNDGNALTTGDQYFNTVSNEMRVWNGSTWQSASVIGGTVTTLSVTGNTTLGDASTDTVTVNANNITTPNGIAINGTTIPSSKTLVVTTDIGSTVQAYDADTTKNDVANTFTANQIISVTDNTNAALRITQLGTGNALLVEDSSNPDSTPTVITADGRMVVGHTSAVTGPGANTSALQTHSTSVFQMGYGGTYWAADANGTSAYLAKSRGATIGTRGIVQNGDEVGRFIFAGDDGTSFLSTAWISSSVDGTPGTNDMPGRLVFSTTADGASSPTERMRIDSAGRIGIGAASTDAILRIGSNLTGGASFTGVSVASTVQSDVSSSPRGFNTFLSTQATAFTFPALVHYRAAQGTIGAGSTLTNQYGFFAETTLTGATNNYGFFSNIASGTGRYNFFAAGTADNYFAGNVGIGSLPAFNLDVSGAGGQAIRVRTLDTSGTNIGRFIASYTGGGGGTPSTVELRAGSGYTFLTSTTNTDLVLGTNTTERMRIDTSGNLLVGFATSTSSLGYAQGSQFYKTSGTIGQFRFSTDNGAPELVSSKARGSAGSATIVANGDGLWLGRFAGYDGTNYVEGARISAEVDGTPGTNDMPGRLIFFTTADGASSPTERMRIDNAGKIGIAGTAQGDTRLHLLGTLPSGSGTSKAQFLQYTIPSTTTGQSVGVLSFPSTQAASFTLGQSMHFYANQGTIGAGSSITNQFGFYAESTLTGATNNYGFYGNIASGTGRYNVYMAGTADNYFGGNVGIGTSSPGGKLHLATGGSTDIVAALGGTFPAFTYRNGTGAWYHAGIHPTSDYFYIGNGGTPTTNISMVVNSSGNVGIGTSSPGFKLDVRGTIAAYDGGTQITQISNAGEIELARTSGDAYIDFKTSTAEDYDCRIQQVSNGLIFQTGGNGSASERMRIDSSGNVLVGTTSATQKMTVAGNIGSTGQFVPYNGSTVLGYIGNDNSITGGTGTNLGIRSETVINFATGGSTERMRIDSSGNLLIGATSFSNSGRLSVAQDATVNEPFVINDTSGSSSLVHAVSFQKSGTEVGSIKNTNTTTSYVTSSDYRLKENIAPMAGALAKVSALKPVTYTWKVDGSSGQGFIAHELAEIVPDCVTGEKDAVELVDITDEEGNVIGQEERPVYQGIDTSFLVATLTAAIQEQQAIITDLKARIETLESK